MAGWTPWIRRFNPLAKRTLPKGIALKAYHDMQYGPFKLKRGDKFEAPKGESVAQFKRLLTMASIVEDSDIDALKEAGIL